MTEPFPFPSEEYARKLVAEHRARVNDEPTPKNWLFQEGWTDEEEPE